MAAVFWVVVSGALIGGQYSPQQLIGTFVFGTLLGYIGAIVAGVPVYFLLSKIGKTSLGIYLIASFAIGALIIEVLASGIVRLVIMWALGHQLVSEMFWFVVAFEIPCGFAGAAAGATFWLIARPDTAKVS